MKRVLVLSIISTMVSISMSIFATIFFEATEQFVEIEGRLKWDDNHAWIITPEDSMLVNSVHPFQLRENGIPYRREIVYRFFGVIEGSELVLYKLSLDSKQIVLRSNNGLLLEELPINVLYMIDPRICIGCRLCVRQCPVGAIRMSRGVAVIDQTMCISCGMCQKGVERGYTGCPVDAIHTEKP